MTQISKDLKSKNEVITQKVKSHNIKNIKEEEQEEPEDVQGKKLNF